MKITLSRDEIKSIVASHYGINSDFFLEISSERSVVSEQLPNASRSSECVITVNSNNQVVDMKKPDVAHSSDHSSTTKRRSTKHPLEMKTCAICGKSFIPRSKKVKTCSTSCRSKLIYQERKDKGASPFKKTVDYQNYGIIIEDFLNSSDSIRKVDTEGMTLDGILYRYNKAAQMFNFEDKVTFCKENKELKMVKEYV